MHIDYRVMTYRPNVVSVLIGYRFLEKIYVLQKDCVLWRVYTRMHVARIQVVSTCIRIHVSWCKRGFRHVLQIY